MKIYEMYSDRKNKEVYFKLSLIQCYKSLWHNDMIESLVIKDDES